MDIIVLDRRNIIKQILQNLVESGVLESHECKTYEQHLLQQNIRQLLLEVVDSQKLREQTPNPASFYPISEEAVNKR